MGAGQGDLSVLPIDTGDGGHAEGHVVGLTEDHPDRIGHIARFEAGRGHLVQQRLKGMEVALVDDGDLDLLADEGPGGRQPGKAGPDDDDPVHPSMVAQCRRAG